MRSTIARRPGRVAPLPADFESAISASLAPLVDRVARYEDDDLGIGILDYRLASEARSGGQARRLVKHVLFLLSRLGEPVRALFHDHMAGGAGAVSTASMLEMDTVAKQDVENRPGAAVMMERRGGGIELDDLLGLAAFINDTQPGHQMSIT